MRGFRALVFHIAIALGIVAPSLRAEDGSVVSPLDFGLAEAGTPLERYDAILRTHQYAVENGLDVSYSGIDTLSLEIPENALSIPLTHINDFSGVVFNVLNNQGRCFLFSLVQDAIPIEVDGHIIDAGSFRKVPELRNGSYLVSIKDRNLWVDNRIGYKYGATRQDILYVFNGRTKSSVVSSYQSEQSDPETSYYAVSQSEKSFGNLVFNRDSGSTAITCLVNISGQYNIRIHDIVVNTPEHHDFNGDACISVDNSARVLLEDIEIHNSYSQADKSGYGVSLNNITDLKVFRMYARAKWGIFGCNNINGATLESCDINRFDIHCYGKGVSFTNCFFSGLYNQFSSVFGTIRFDRCTFTDFVPLLIESSYNAYVPFDIVWKGCVFNMNKKHNYLIDAMRLTPTPNNRKELSSKCLPNVYMTDCEIHLEDGIHACYVFNTGKVTYKGKVEHLSKVHIDDLKMSDSKSKLEIFSQKINTKPEFSIICKISD